MSFLSREGDKVPWWWPGVVRPDQSREDVTFQEAFQDVRDWALPAPNPSPIPFVFGTAAAAAPYAAGAALVWFGPTPYHKAVGASMLWPGPTDVVFFGLGYEFGEQVESWL